MTPAALLPAVADIARRAGEIILDVYGTAFDVQEKDDRSPLTLADERSHRLIVDSLHRLTPDIPVLSEEAAAVPFAERSVWPAFWLVDPLDGTKEFVSRNGEFTVNIALVEGHEAALGVVYAPVLDRTYTAARDSGAFRRDGPGQPRKIKVRVPPHDPPVVVGSRSHAGDSLAAVLSKLGAHELRSMGSSLKLCLVAEGEADFYPRLGPTSEWDTAAAQAVVECAGGAVVNAERGGPLEYNTRESILNPYFLVYGDASLDWLALVRD
jgi:3'(2'), 5'-bisphosphate nucleotidase